jgi:predicted phage terminase large subunit-like protein
MVALSGGGSEVGAFGRARARWAARVGVAESARERWATPGALMAALDPSTVQTAALDVIDRELVRAITTPNSRLIISLPPQEGKSTRVTKGFSLWALCQDPERRVSIVSYSDDLARDFGRDIRRMITDNQGQDDGLDLGLRLSRDSAAANQWRLEGHRGGVRAVGIGGSLTGKSSDLMIIDDPLKDKIQADSPTYRERAWSFWTAVAGTRLSPGAPVIVVMTRWHEDDLAGRLLKAPDAHRWRVVNIPAVADHNPALGQTDPLGRAPGEWLDSARRRTLSEWQDIRIAAGTRVWNALYQGRPAPEAGDVWQRQWWRRYQEAMWTVDPTTGAYRVEGFDEVIQSWDCAFKATRDSDYVVGQVWGRRGANAYLLWHSQRRLSFTDTVAAVTACSRQWPQATVKLVEDKANGTAVIDTLKSKIPGIVPVNPTDSKYGRATAVAPFLEAGNVWLPEPGVALFDTESLVEEAAAFPNGAHDDQVDATSQALSRLLLRVGPGAGYVQWLKSRVTAQQKVGA